MHLPPFFGFPHGPLEFLQDFLVVQIERQKDYIAAWMEELDDPDRNEEILALIKQSEEDLQSILPALPSQKDPVDQLRELAQDAAETRQMQDWLRQGDIDRALEYMKAAVEVLKLIQQHDTRGICQYLRDEMEFRKAELKAIAEQPRLALLRRSRKRARTRALGELQLLKLLVLQLEA